MNAEELFNRHARVRDTDRYLMTQEQFANALEESRDELMELIDGAYPVVDSWIPEAKSAKAWKTEWLTRAKSLVG